MQNKLTLSLDLEVIEKAKIYASRHKISISKLIEIYLDNLTKVSNESLFSPSVESLIGVVELPTDFDYKEEIPNLISEKNQ